MTLGEVLARATEHLGAHGSETPRLDAELLLAHVLGCERIALYTDFERPLSEDERDRYRAVVGRRSRHEPVAYLVGTQGFRRLVLNVDGNVLVPRPETEVVVERCLALLSGSTRPRVLDVGTGSGAIALAIADEHPGAEVTGVDISVEALALARENASATGIAIELAEADVLQGIPAGPWDLIVSNPPYVDVADYDGLMPDVRDFEPRGAVVAAGQTEALAAHAVQALAPGGALVFEVGVGQAASGAQLLERLGYGRVRITNDLAGIERVVEGLR